MRIFHLRGGFQHIWYSNLPFALGIGCFRVAAGVTYSRGTPANVLDQARAFSGIRSIDTRSSWLVALEGGLGYVIPSSRITVTANFDLNYHMEFLHEPDFLIITMAPTSAYSSAGARVSPVYLNVGVLVEL